MFHRVMITALLLAFFAADAEAQNRSYRRRGTILGGLAGAGIGAAIGNNNDNAVAGALIGGAVGAIAGGRIGERRDQRTPYPTHHHSGYRPPEYTPYGYAHPYGPHPAYRQPSYPYPGPVVVAPHLRPVTVADVIDLHRRGVGEATMIRLIQTHGVTSEPSVSQVIDMHESGVSERVIAVMQGDPVQLRDESDPIYPLPPPPEPFGPSIVAPSNAP